MLHRFSTTLFLGSNNEEMAELLKYKDFVHPPSIDELRKQTEEAFSHKYIKYMYARFKNVSFFCNFYLSTAAWISYCFVVFGYWTVYKINQKELLHCSKVSVRWIK